MNQYTCKNIYHCKKCKDKSWLIECACGRCDDVLTLRDCNLRIKKFKHGHNNTGPLAYNYKGSSSSGNGYLYVKRPHHRYSDSRGRVLKHRYEMELQIGRYLTDKEEVHHIDENKLNNDINNLKLLSITEHRKLHSNKDYSDRYCNICKLKDTYVDKKGMPVWHKDGNGGWICFYCYSLIRRFIIKGT